MYFFVTILTAIALSLDAFSLAIIYGTILNNKKKILILSLVVGIFHFFMPLLGFTLSNLLITQMLSNTNFISFLIFLIIGIQMFFSKNSENEIINLTRFSNVLLFAFTVSLDSFSVGIAISDKKILLPIVTFSIVSCLFTYIGLQIGNKIKNVFGSLTTKIGGIILILLSFYYLFT